MNADPAPSLTGTPSFRLRIQLSEQYRAFLMGALYLFLLIVTVTRRSTGGVVMSKDLTFYWYAGILLAGLIYEVMVHSKLRAANQRSTLVAGWRLDLTLLVEFLVPSLAMLGLFLTSPRGEYAALSAPVILVFPITVMVSILRLRPKATLLLGVALGLFHLVLSTTVFRNASIDRSHVPVLASHGVLLLFAGIGGMIVTSAARRYVIEATEEAVSRERTAARLAEVDRDMEIARDIQSDLLPDVQPNFPGFEFAGLNIPAEKTGGDYYDWQMLPDGRLLVVMADVTGHGIGPALVMAICRAYARASAPLMTDLNMLLGRLNDLLCEDLSSGRFITLAVALLDAHGQAQLLSAGHGPTMMYRAAAKSVEDYGGDGLPLAVMPAATYGPIRSFPIEHGDVLVMMTDGLFEWANTSSELFGIQRVAETLKRSAHKSAKEILDDLLQAARSFSGGTPQADDLTIAVIKRCG